MKILEPVTGTHIPDYILKMWNDVSSGKEEAIMADVNDILITMIYKKSKEAYASISTINIDSLIKEILSRREVIQIQSPSSIYSIGTCLFIKEVNK